MKFGEEFGGLKMGLSGSWGLKWLMSSLWNLVGETVSTASGGLLVSVVTGKPISLNRGC